MGFETSMASTQFVLNGEVMNLLDLGEGRVKWDVQTAPGELGDDPKLKTAPLEMHGGFGATHRIRRANGTPSDPAHHAYGQNASAQFEGVTYPSPIITYVDGSAYAPDMGGDDVIGGTGTPVGGEGDPIGGGAAEYPAQHIVEYGDYLYVAFGPYTLVLDIDQAAPSFVEGKFHGVNARNRWLERFSTNGLIAPLGANELMAVATTPYTSSQQTAWSASQVYMDTARLGVGGRLFTSRGGRVYGVNPDDSALVSANFKPSNGEVITDESNPVRGLIEFASALVAGTPRGARTLDPNRGYVGVPITGASRLSASEYDGRAMISVGGVLFYATQRGITMIVPGQRPVDVGPEQLHHNDTPYKGIEWGVPDWLGNWMAWPAYIPATGDSVIFLAKIRDREDIGSGSVVWHDWLYLEDRESRCAYMYGGGDTSGPRLVFGAGTTTNPYAVGWVDLSADGGPDPFTSDGHPARTAMIRTALDDLGTPGVLKVPERVVIPYLHGADASNYVRVRALLGHDTTSDYFVKAQSGSNQDRLNSEGVQSVFLPTSVLGTITNYSAPELGIEFSFVQAANANAHWLVMHGVPVLYYYEIPDRVRVITAVVDSETTDEKQAEAIATTLRALIPRGHVRLQRGHGGEDIYVKVMDVMVTNGENHGGPGANPNTRLGIQVLMREVLVA